MTGSHLAGTPFIHDIVREFYPFEDTFLIKDNKFLAAVLSDASPAGLHYLGSCIFTLQPDTEYLLIRDFLECLSFRLITLLQILEIWNITLEI